MRFQTGWKLRYARTEKCICSVMREEKSLKSLKLWIRDFILPRSEYSEDKKLVRDNFLYILLMAVGLFGTSYFQTAAASRMDAIILYPLSSALSLVAGSTMASIFFKEKIKRDCVIGVIIVFLALILSRADTLFIK